MLCIKFGYNWPSGSGEVVNIFLHCYAIVLSFEEGLTLHLNKLEVSCAMFGLKLAWWLMWRNNRKCETFITITTTTTM